MNTQTPIIRRGRKFEQVLIGAREIFLRDGFEGASVDDIARAAGVSKATLYSYFADKRLLFSEVVTTECDRMAEETLELVDETEPPQEVLLMAARRLTRFLLSDFAQSMFRICVAEADRFPELGAAFYRAGPDKGRERICEYLQGAVDRRELFIADLPMAADQFAELCKVRLFIRGVFGVQTTFDDAEIELTAQEAVVTFMARYGPKVPST